MANRTLHKSIRRRGRTSPANTNAKRDAGAAFRKLTTTVPAGATIRRQYVHCGKCPRWHGPYWYAYWTKGGKTHSAYIGSDERLARFLDARTGRADSVDYLTEPGAPKASAVRGKGVAVARAIGLIDEDADELPSIVPAARRRRGGRGPHGPGCLCDSFYNVHPKCPAPSAAGARKGAAVLREGAGRVARVARVATRRRR